MVYTRLGRSGLKVSLRRLGVDFIDLYQMHHVDRDTPWEEIWQAMEILALAWLLHNPVVTAPIIGPRTEEQLDGALRALEIRIDGAARAKLDEMFPGPGKPAPEAYAW